MQEKAKEPEIRFAGFTGAWEQRSLGEICVPVQRNDPYSHAPVMMITASSGFIYQSVRYSFDNSGQSLQKYTLLKKGELAYNHGASKLRPFGSCFALNVKEARIPFVYHSFAVNDDDPEFVSLELNGTNVEKQLRKLVSSGARMDGLLNISFDDYGTVTLPLPSIDEQKKISSFFLKLDSLLTLHQRKYEKLLNIKKSMLEKMFPKEGEVVPEIRFKGFTGAWEQRKLGNLGETYTGLSGKSKEEFGHGTAKFITYMNVYSNPVSDPEGTDLIEVDNRQNTVRKGDVLFTTSSETPEEVGMSSVVFESIENTYLNSFCFGYRPKIEFNNFYLAFLLRSGGFRKNIIFLAQGISRYNISKNAVMNIPIPIPAKEEQEAIGDFFKHLDALLTLHQRKLEMLKNVKQAFLEKMFV